MPLYHYRCPQCGAARDEFAHVAERHSGAPACHGAMKLEIMPTHVIGDIDPYRATVLDVKDEHKPQEERKPPVIGGRRAHRQFLKRNRLVEVGDKPVTPTKTMRKIIDKDSDRRSLREQMRPVVTEALRRGQR